MTPVGRYEMLSLLGKGGMGEVWRARDTELDRVVALKLLQRTSQGDLARFRREAHAVARLNHPNIAQLYAFGGDPPHLAMQFVEGEPIAKPEHLAAAARAVHYAHEQGILHRDLKPANILVDATGRAFVLDFGLAREVKGDVTAMSVTGDVLGTPSYMAPEQAKGDVAHLDARTDVYGLGATLYALLEGRPPHTGPTAYDVIRKVIEEDPPAPKGELGVIAMKAIDKDPARRYATAADFADDLDRHFRDEPIRARPASVAYRLRKQIARRPAVWGLSTLLAVAILGGGAFGVIQLANVAAERGAKVEEQEGRLRAEADLRAALEAQLAAERAAAERARVVGVMESAYRRLTAWDEEMSATQTDERLEEIRQGARQTIADLEAEFPNAEEEAALWYLLGQAHQALFEEEPAEECYGHALEHEEGLWGCAISVQSRSVLARARSRLQRMVELLRGPTDQEIEARRGEALELLPLIQQDLAQAGERDVPPRLRRIAELWGEYLARAPDSWERLRREAGEEIDRGGRNEEFHLLRALVETGAEAVADFSASLDRHHGRPGVWALKGLANRDLGDWRLAIRDYDEAIRLRPGYADALNSRGCAYDHLGQAERGIEDFDEAIRLRPDFAAAFNNRGMAYSHLGDRRRAMEDFDEAIRLLPGFSAAFNNRGSTFNDLGEPRRAIEDLDEAIRLQPGVPDQFSNRGISYYNLGDARRAIEDYDEAIRLRPDCAPAFNNRGLAFAALGEPRRAVEDYDEALRLQPLYVQAIKNRAWAFVALGEYDRALLNLQHALELDPRSSSAPTTRQQIEQLRRILASGAPLPVPDDAERVEGRLEAGDAAREGGAFADEHEVAGRAGQRLTVTLESPDFDAFLIVTGSNGFRQECDDFLGMRTNSRIDVTLPADGTYTVAATSYGAGETGAYVLRIWLRDEEPERR